MCDAPSRCVAHHRFHPCVSNNTIPPYPYPYPQSLSLSLLTLITTMDFSNLPPDVLQAFASMMASGHLQIPPPIFVEMDGRIETMDMAQAQLTISFPIQPRYQNPVGYMQGGMIAAAVDNAIGPLSFLVAPPSVTKTLTMSYLLPVQPSHERIWVTARFLGREGAQLRFTADVHTADGTLLAQAEALHSILRDRHKSKPT